MTDERKSLEQLLDEYSVAPASTQLRARILSAAKNALDPGVRRDDRKSWIEILRDEIFGWRPALPAFALALCFGIALGLTDEGEEPTDLVQMAAYQQDLEEEY